MDTNTTLNFIIKRPEVVDDTGDSPSVPYTSAGRAATSTGSAAPAASSTVQQGNAQTTFVSAPNTGENTRLDFSNSVKSPVNFLPIIFVIFAVVLLAISVYRRQKSHLKFSKSSFRLARSPFVLSLSTAGVLTAAFLSSSLFSHGYIDNDLNASSSSHIALASDSVIDGKIDDYFDMKELAYISVAKVAVETSSDYDYHLYMRAKTDKLYLNGNENSAYYFNPVSDEGDSLNSQDGAWGYSIIQDYLEQYCYNSTDDDSLRGCDTSKFIATPTKDTEILKSNTSRNPFLIFFAANPSDGLPNGTYSTEIIYTLVSDEPAASQTSAAMQNWSGCANLKTGETVSLADSRDGKTYQVRKLVDGKCWMVDDLAFTKDMTLTSADSNVMSSTNITFKKDASSDGQTDKVARYFDHDGSIMYNYYAATAGGSHLDDGTNEGNVIITSICPAGWHLPTGENGTGEFAMLEFAASDVASYFSSPTGAAFKVNGYYDLDGIYYGLDTQGGGSYWSSTVSDSDNAHELHMYTDAMNTSCAWPKDYSVSVRCVQGNLPVPIDTEESPETPDTPETPDNPNTPETSANCVITATNPCTLKDGRSWILGNSGNTTTWGNIFTGGNGTEGHDGTVKSNACPTGYSAPKITDYDALVRAYGGQERTETNGRTGYLATGNNLLFKAFGGQSDTIAFWSSTEQNTSNAYYFSVSNGTAYSAPHHAKVTDYYKFACYKSTD